VLESAPPFTAAVQDILIENGVIIATGGAARQRARPDIPMHDAADHLITPGFVNAHSHAHDTWLRGRFEQLPLEVWGLSAFPTSWPKRSLELIRLRTALHADECLRSGITTLQDMVTIIGDDPAEALAIAETYAEFGLTAIVTPQFNDRAIVDGIPFAAACMPPQLRAMLPGARDIAGIEAFLAEIFAQRVPPNIGYALGPVQPQLCSDELLLRVAALAETHDLQISTHLYETRAEAVLARQTLGRDGGSAVARLARLGLLGPRLVFGHGVWITPREIASCAAAGANLACNAVTNLKLLNGAPPLGAYAAAGVTISLGCDNTSAGDAQDIFAVMKLAALTLGQQSPAGATGAAASIFAAATTGGAQALGLQNRIGRIQPGYRADLALFDLSDPNWRPLNSPLNQLIYGNPGRSLASVFAGGERLLHNRQAVRPNRLAAQAEAIRPQLDAEFLDVERQAARLRAPFLEIFRRAADYPLPEFTGGAQDRP
jgi:guanine deaminase